MNSTITQPDDDKISKASSFVRMTPKVERVPLNGSREIQEGIPNYKKIL